MNNIKNLLTAYKFTPKKKLGQNFLKDEHVLKKIIAAADINQNDIVLEIGAGLGTLTHELLNCKFLYAIELDVKLAEILKKMFTNKNIKIIQGDILKIDLPSLLRGQNAIAFPLGIGTGMNPVPASRTLPNVPAAAMNTASPFCGGTDNSLRNCYIKAIANLPYYITTPIILYLLESGICFNSIIIMIQKEVAKRLTASPSTKDYGSLTLAVGYYADVELIANVPANSFIPRPNVDSAVIKLTLLERPRVDTSKDALFKVIHAAFNQRRKTLVNALAANLPIEKDRIISAMESLKLNKDIRGETLDIFQFAKLAEVLL